MTEEYGTPPKLKNPMKSKRRIRILIICITVLAIAVVGWQLFIRMREASATNTAEQRVASVMRGDFSVSIPGSAPLQPISKQTISAGLDATITDVLVQNGDTVQAGDLLMVLDDSDASAALDLAQADLDDARADAASTLSDMAALTVHAPFSGVVTALSIQEEDNLQKNSVLFTLTDVDNLLLSVPFGISDRDVIRPGLIATLAFYGMEGTVEGTVQYVAQTGTASASGGEAIEVEILLKNPGAIVAGTEASVTLETTVGPLTALETGTLEYANSRVLRTDTGGIASHIAVRDNQHVSAGSLLLQLKNQDLDKTMQANQRQIERLEKALEAAQEDLLNCQVRAPIAGIITDLSLSIGETTRVGSSLCAILDSSQMVMNVSIDELDIVSIQTGQFVTAVVDALAETAITPLTGTVTGIAVEGVTSNGVTTYPVTLNMAADERLKSGMNADASILITSRTQVLMVPIEAVITLNGNSFVYLLGQEDIRAMPDEPSSDQQENTPGMTGDVRQPNTAEDGFRQGMQDRPGRLAQDAGARRPATTDGYYSGSVLVMVQTGEHNESWMEIVNGLSEGDQIVLPPLTVSSGTAPQETGGTGFAIPGMTGGMPGGMTGGMPNAGGRDAIGARPPGN